MWLKPAGKAAHDIQKEIERLSNECRTPTFNAHITLVSSLFEEEELLLEHTEELADVLNPFSVRLTQAGYRDHYFQNLFVHCEPGDKLMSARRKAVELFNADADPTDFEPHVSLLYGYLNSEEKEKMLEEIAHLFDTTLQIEAIQLVHVQGTVAEWEQVAEFSL